MTREDVLYRTQHLVKYLVDYLDYIVSNLMNGYHCQADIRRYVLLDSYIRTLICNTPREEIRAVGQIQIVSANAGSSIISVLVDNAGDPTPNILGSAISYNGSVPQMAEAVAKQINNYVSSPDYFATVIPGTGYINIYAGSGQGDTPNGLLVEAFTNGVITVNIIVNMQGGVDGQDIDDMCLSAEEMEDIFKHISELTGLCFLSENSSYSYPTVNISGTGIDIFDGMTGATTPIGVGIGILTDRGEVTTDGGDQMTDSGGNVIQVTKTETRDRGAY